MLDRWTPEQTEDGTYIGTALRAIASQQKHQAGITDFAAQLSAEVARSPDHDLLDVLPTQRSQISCRSGFKNFVLHPDASFQLGYQGDWDWCLLEYERRTTTPKRVPERLLPYRRYFRSCYARLDHGGAWPLVLFVFESAEAEETFVEVAASLDTLDHAPFRQQPHRRARQARSPGRLMAPAAPASARTTVPARPRQCHPACPNFPIRPCRAFPVGATPPHPPVQQLSSPENRSALDFPPPPDRVVRLLSSRTSLSGHLSATVGNLLQMESGCLQGDPISRRSPKGSPARLVVATQECNDGRHR